MTETESVYAAQLTKDLAESAAKILVFCGRIDAEAHWDNLVRLHGWTSLVRREAVAMSDRVRQFCEQVTP